MTLGIIALVSLVIASAWALMGTNMQARLSRERLLNDPDDEIVRAGRLWRPAPRWLRRKVRRRQLEAIESRLLSGPEAAARYAHLRSELYAWNALESSVALGFFGAVLAVIATVWGPVISHLRTSVTPGRFRPNQAQLGQIRRPRPVLCCSARR